MENKGISREDAVQAVADGWDKNLLLCCNVWCRTAKYMRPWGFLLDDRYLVYRDTSLGRLEEGRRYVATAYADGSGTTAGKVAGIGVVIQVPLVPPVFLSQNVGLGTNNYAELRALWCAIRYFPDIKQKLTIFTDSEYAKNIVTQLSWNATANAELVTMIREDLAMRKGQVEIIHVNGHSKVSGNEQADCLANMGRKWIKEVTPI